MKKERKKEVKRERKKERKKEIIFYCTNLTVLAQILFTHTTYTFIHYKLILKNNNINQ